MSKPGLPGISNLIPRSVEQLREDYKFRPGGSFGSQDEVTAAMSDSRYRHDAAFRQAVMEKFANTDRTTWTPVAEHSPTQGLNWRRTYAAPGTEDEGPRW